MQHLIPLFTENQSIPDFRFSIFNDDNNDSPIDYSEYIYFYLFIINNRTYKIQSYLPPLPIAQMIKDVGYFATSSVEYFRSILNRLDVKLNDEIISDILLMMMTSLNGLDTDKDGVNLSIGSLCDSYFPNKSIPSIPNEKSMESVPRLTTWNSQVVSQLIFEDYPQSNWENIIKYLDKPIHNKSDIATGSIYNNNNSSDITLAGVQFLVNIVLQFSKIQFPGHVLCNKWKNPDTQFKILNEIVKAPSEMVSFKKTPNHLNTTVDYGTWSSIDLMDTFLYFCETKYYPQVLLTLSIPLTTCPTALFLLILCSKGGDSECKRHLIFQSLSSYFLNTPPIQDPTKPLNINEIINYINGLNDIKINHILAQYFSIYLSTQINLSNINNKPEGTDLILNYISQYKDVIGSSYSNILECTKCIPDNANAIFQSIYNHEKTIEEVIIMLKSYQNSNYPLQKETINYMVNNLFLEFNFFQEYPDKELNITAELLGQLIANNLVDDVRLEEAFRSIKQWLSPTSNERMIKFAIEVINKAKVRILSNPIYYQVLFNNPFIRSYSQQIFDEKISIPIPIPIPPSLNIPSRMPSMIPQTLPNTASTAAIPPSLQPQVQPVIPPPPPSVVGNDNNTIFKRCIRYVEPLPIINPPNNVKDTIAFKVNNLAIGNMKETAATIKSLITDEYIPWFADYIVLKRIATLDILFLPVYLQLLEELNIPKLIDIVHTRSLQVLCDLLTSSAIQESNERTMIRSFAEWISINTIQRNKPVLYRDINLKELLLVGYENGKLYVVLAFVCTLLKGCAESKIFNVNNYWIKSLFSILLEIKNLRGLKSGLQYQIELLLDYHIKTGNSIQPSDLLRTRKPPNISNNEDFTDDGQQQQINLAQQQAQAQLQAQQAQLQAQQQAQLQAQQQQQINPQVVGNGINMNMMNMQYPGNLINNNNPLPILQQQQPNRLLNNNGRLNESMTQIPHLEKYITINKSLTLFTEQPSLLQYVYSAIDSAFREVTSPVVTRTVSIAMKTCQQLLFKDFNGEKDLKKLIYPGRVLAGSLASSLSLISSREELNNKMMDKLVNQLSTVCGLNKEELNKLCEEITNDNIDLGIQYIERTAYLRASPRIDQLIQKTNLQTTVQQQQQENENDNNGEGKEEIEKKLSQIPICLRAGDTESNEHIYDFLKHKVDFRKKTKRFIEGSYEDRIYVSHLLNMWIMSINELYEPNLEEIKNEIGNKNENEMEILFSLLLDEVMDIYKLDKYKHMKGNDDYYYSSVDGLSRFISQYFQYDDNNKIFLKSVIRAITNHLLFTHDLYMENINNNQNNDDEEWYQNIYFRLFVDLLNELINFSELSIQQLYDLLSILSNSFITLQPKRVPIFAFSWIQLISHRFFLPKLLSYPNEQLWPYMEQLLLSLLSFFYPYFITELSDSLKLLYKGTLRVLLILLHDYPEFLGAYHFSLCDNIPLRCVQLRNIILSAFPKSMQLPDPFTPHLRIESLQGITQAPIIKSDICNNLIKYNIKADIDAYISTNTINNDFLAVLISKLKLSDNNNNNNESNYNIPLINSLSLYLGIQGINLMCRSIDNSGTKDATVMNIFLYMAKNLDCEGRFIFFNSLANQLRYPNSYTHYFSCVILYLFYENSKAEVIREQITRVLIERLIVHRPHPWGLLITFYELLQNPKYEFWNHEFTRRTPDIQKLFDSVARSCQNTSGGRTLPRN